MQSRIAITTLVALALVACAPDKIPTEVATTTPSLDRDGRGDDDDNDDGEDKDNQGGRGAVYTMSNEPTGNRVVVFNREKDGMLTPGGSFATGGTGSGGFEDTANGLVLGSTRGESAPNNLIGSSKFLFATNAGSNSISVFRVKKNGLDLVEVQNSNGEKPVSVTVNRGLVYVLNSGETIDGLVPPNCEEGIPSVTGFVIDGNGALTPIPGSTRILSMAGTDPSGCAQVSFNPKGTVLVVTERTAKTATQAPGDEGVINTFVVNKDGTLGQRRRYDATGQGPFGFTFNKSGALLTTEQFDGAAGPFEGAAAGYRLNDDGTLTPTSPSVKNGGTDTCWFVLTDNGKFGYTASFFGDGQISLYRVGRDGSLELVESDADGGAATTGASDMALSRNSHFLYQLNSLEGTINAFRVNSNGSLTFLQTVLATRPDPMGATLGLAAR
jgi:6-phosphogluconolactonase (cycloisomerase 2 family)